MRYVHAALSSKSLCVVAFGPPHDIHNALQVVQMGSISLKDGIEAGDILIADVNCEPKELLLALGDKQEQLQVCMHDNMLALKHVEELLTKAGTDTGSLDVKCAFGHMELGSNLQWLDDGGVALDIFKEGCLFPHTNTSTTIDTTTTTATVLATKTKDGWKAELSASVAHLIKETNEGGWSIKSLTVTADTPDFSITLMPGAPSAPPPSGEKKPFKKDKPVDVMGLIGEDEEGENTDENE
ncbi:unnamed protein product [Vitrella brassicaformis CCMP3155]|uniref:Uncharacterized protein n=2 Tax=Vitrella brassicaformis TaxID=1169539 RepID=A0A0G4EAH6_VITBC|nr:unnamed protein product [Vitrella brassicaformis CCMP3155]|eukprot:CEL92615.1 unnamed protein product [Vitrella brassicaformis CCMP3155]